jgi:hypothetical protein
MMGYSPFMQPLVRAAVYAALIAAVGMFGLTKSKKVEPAPIVPARTAPPLAVSCGPLHLPEGDVCVPIPRSGQTDVPGPLDHVPRALRERSAVIPRRPERPPDAASYRFPLARGVKPVVLAGLDLPPDTMPDIELGSAAVLLGASIGDEVVAVTLEGQEGPAEVAFVGEIVGKTVVTIHLIRDGGRLRQYLLVHGYLDRPSEQAIVGSTIEEDDVLGYVGNLPAGRDVLYLEARQVREGVVPSAVNGAKLLDDNTSVACDVRNVLRQGASL